MKRILMIVPAPNDPTSWYRAMGPFTHLNKQIHDLDLIFAVDTLNDIDVLNSDIVFMQRPFLPQHLQAARVIKKMNRPLWLDYDDNLFAVPTDNPTYGMYGSQRGQSDLKEIMSLADVITVSTDHLRQKILEVNPMVITIPNALDEITLGFREHRHTLREKIIVWRGSASHERDLRSVADQIIDISNDQKFEEWTWYFIGYNPWFITDKMPKKNVVIMPQKSFLEYFHVLNALNSAIHIVPLDKNEFNLSKSNIAWMEAMFAGGICIAPDMPEWKRNGTCLYNDPSHFWSYLTSAMILGNEQIKIENQAGWEFVKSELSLLNVNNARAKIIENLYRINKGWKS